MFKLAIIGGTGLTTLEGLRIKQRKIVKTPYGVPSSALVYGELGGHPLVFLARHGHGHTIPPHQINYRANVWALKHIGVTHAIAVASVGGIHAEMLPEHLVIPHQLIDYSYGRAHTFFDSDLEYVTHVDFTHPYCEALRLKLIEAGKQAQVIVHPQGVYAATQGPRLETSAEINRMERDGCDLVGMTGMPEAVLMRELDMCYAACAVVANKAAGRGPDTLTIADIKASLEHGMKNVRRLLSCAIPLLFGGDKA
jgi:5'-methylthioinosine phosphorylase